MEAPKKPSRLRRVARAFATLLLCTAVVAVAVGYWAYEQRFLPWYLPIEAEAIDQVDAHWNLTTSHPGWSFHAEIFSSATPLDLPPARLAAEARARGYQAVCPPTKPGEYCAKTGAVVLRGGQFPEGIQPPGNDGWTRPLALEPLELGWLVGPDAELREHLPLSAAPPQLVQALLASEDERFRSHQGVDLKGFIRAAWVNYQAGGFSQGASTLDMQLMRNLTGKKDRSIERKLAEMAQAYAVDRYAGKDRILQMYLDAPYLAQFGNYSVCGFEMAARYYYGVDASALSLSQAATLVGILPAPANFSPDKHPDLAKGKRDRVLRRMRVLGWDAAAVEAALAEPIVSTPHNLIPPERFPAYFAATRDALLATFPAQVAYGAGLDVYTAMDPVVQQQTEQVLEEKTPFLDRLLAGRGVGPLISATAVVDPRTGRLVAVHDSAILGSNDFSRATQMRRQAGSSFKPVVYSLAFAPGADGKPRMRPDDTVQDVTKTFNKGTKDAWTPHNANGWYMPRITLARALAVSANVAACCLLEELGGPDPLIDYATTLGFDTSAFPHEMGLALGQGQVTPLEMARFVGTIANGGRRLSASPVSVAIDAFGRTRYETPLPTEQVMTPTAALYTRELMRLVVTSGTGWSVKGRYGTDGYRGDIVGKTGTATDDKDLWFIGATPDYAAAVWVGYELPASVGGHAGEVAAPLFGWLMQAIHEGIAEPTFPVDDIERRYVCANSGLAGNPTCPGIQMPFLKGTGPRGGCPQQHDPYDLAPPPPKDAAAVAVPP